MMWICLGLIFISSATAQVIEPGTCPEVKTKANFEVEKYLGKWYDYQHYAAAFAPEGKCGTAIYGANPNGTVSVTNSAILPNGEKTGIVGYAFASTAEKSKLSVVFPSVPGRVGSYWVLDTDYTSYTVVWSCTQYGAQSFKFAWVLTRERNPAASVLQKAQKVLESNKIDQSFFQKSDQKNCSEYY